jgi:branched-subunit amino acid ABC-type transport system permease component
VPHIIAFVVSFVLAIGLFIMLRSTDFGRSIRAVHQNAHAASLMGINVGRVQVLTFALGIGILALAAALLLPGTPIQPTQGLRYTVITLLVVVLGGTSAQARHQYVAGSGDLRGHLWRARCDHCLDRLPLPAWPSFFRADYAGLC